MSSTDIPIESVKIKEEKLDPEIERKLNPSILPDSTNLQDDAIHVDEKKNIEPIKSSNEILAELFKVFNATPPEELLNNDKLVKKAKKEHKRSKHKKSKKHKRKTGENSGISDNESLHSGSSKHKKKKHKRKHKKHKDKNYDHGTDGEEKTVIMAADSSSSTKLKQSVKIELVESVDFKREKSSLNKSDCRGRIEKRLQSCSRVEEGSDVTLSDEETYLRERNRYKESANIESPKRPEYDRYRNDFYRNSNNSYYSSKRQDRGYRYNHRSRSRSRLRTRSRSISKSRSRSPHRDLGIDKKRLLEIARKNAITMFKSGSLPGCATMSEEIKDKVLLKMRYGGKTVQDLTDFCRKLTKNENYDELSDFSSEEDSDMDKQGNAKAFHHPFVLKDREPIVMHIKNATPIVPKTADQKKAITMQFPVSSGQQHRLTEAWVPVPAKEPEIPPLIIPAIAKQVPNKPMGIPKNVFQKQLPVEEQQPAFKPLPGGVVPTPEVSPQEAVPVVPVVPVPAPMVVPPPTIPEAPIVITPIRAAPIIPTPIITAPTPQSVYPVPQQTVDVSTIISQRLSAMRRLQENPMDCEAIKMMYTSQKEMTSWASSKHMPGQFTGSTGANILTARELTSGSQAWARKDQLTATVPVSGGMGMHLLKKMGWKPGEGLGREKTGSLQPLLLDVKLDKRGLVADEEVNGNRQQQKTPPVPNAKRKKNIPAQAVPTNMPNLDNKHPVCLLNELSTKRKWTPPMYELVKDEGPSHNKFFVFSVNVNGQVFIPTAGGNTKKEAKLLTAKYCLQQMGVLS